MQMQLDAPSCMKVSINLNCAVAPAAANQQAPERQAPLTARKTYSKSGMLGLHAAGLETNLVLFGLSQTVSEVGVGCSWGPTRPQCGWCQPWRLVRKVELLTPDRF